MLVREERNFFRLASVLLVGIRHRGKRMDKKMYDSERRSMMWHPANKPQRMPKPLRWIVYFGIGTVVFGLALLTMLVMGSPVPIVVELPEAPAEQEALYDGEGSTRDGVWWGK